MSSKHGKLASLSEQNSEKIEILKDLVGPTGCSSLLIKDVKNACWLRQLELIESFVREVPEYIDCMVDSLKITNVCDRKNLKSWRKKILNHFKAKVYELKDKIDETLNKVDAISEDMKQEHHLGREVEQEIDALCISSVEMHKNAVETLKNKDEKSQISKYLQDNLEENIIIDAPNNDISTDDERCAGEKHKPAQFTCLDCSDLMTSLRALYRHRRQVHGELKPHKCDRCPMAFQNSSALRKHLRTPHNRDAKRQPYLCDLCPQICADKSVFKIHRRTHTGENSFVCDICSRSLGTKNSLVQHMRTHTNERPFVCPQCSKTFRQETGFRRHQLRHTDHRPHKCNWCIKAFLTKCQLSRHLLSHTGERPHVCPICKRGYTKRYACKKHIRNAHKDVDVDVVFPNLVQRTNKITAE